MIVEAAIVCLALNVYYEAPKESYEGQMAVAQVVVRRAKQTHGEQWENWVCPTVYAKRQFTWTTRFNSKVPDPENKELWDKSRSIARQALLWGYVKHLPDHSGGADHYHADYVNPRWARAPEMQRTVRIGRHIFLRDTRIGE